MYLFSKIPEQSHSTLMYCTVHVFEKCIFFLLKKRCWISNLQYLPSQLQSNMITTCADDTLIKKETITCSIKPKICHLGQIQNYLILKLEEDSKEFNSSVDRVKAYRSKGCRFDSHWWSNIFFSVSSLKDGSSIPPERKIYTTTFYSRTIVTSTYNSRTFDTTSTFLT